MDLSALPGHPKLSQAALLEVLPECMLAPCHGGDRDQEEIIQIPTPMSPPAKPAKPEVTAWRREDILIQSVRLADVRAEAKVTEVGGGCFNTFGLWEWAPFRFLGGEEVQVDSAWWASLPVEQQAAIACSTKVVQAVDVIELPHSREIGSNRFCRQVLDSYKQGFEFAYWQDLKPEARLVPLRQRDRRVLANVALNRIFSGEDLQPHDLEELSSDFLTNLKDAIHQVGGRAFVKAPQKSAKNDLTMRAHSQPDTVLDELTASKDVLINALGSRTAPAQYLVVQPWRDDISAAREFRVIIANRRVAGISQQAWFKSVGHCKETATSAAQCLLHLWYAKLVHVCPYFDCVLDAYVCNGEAYLIEVNPCGWWGTSGSALFHWDHDRDLLLDTETIPVRIVVARPDASTISVDSPYDIDSD
eukprot:TRINITY_DN94219_c0_g1_i1.p1 TRINITY_DN94219_c0_g1~~TRINITY_DN94219_c0_g1_i1.p1  ORF type:complete len:417 (+),score=42.88 TRINITY_DN94219_c0_g1_i1:23-1273(+)